MTTQAVRPRSTSERSPILYDQLLALAPTPVVALNRAVAVAERDGPADALELLRRRRDLAVQ